MKVAFAERLKTDWQGVAHKLSGGVVDVRRQLGARDMKHQTTVLLTDGLSGSGERLVTELYDRAQGGAQIVGGAAGDEGKFKLTHVGAGERTASDAAAAMHVFSASPWGVGVDHGLRSTTKQMRVTRAVGNVVFELDGEPAFATYVRHAAARGVELTPANAAPYLIGNELGIHFFERIIRARAPLAVGPDGSLSCAADIPQGSMVSILDGDPPSMVEAARSAALEAKEHLGSGEAAGVLLFDCVCRGMILKDGFDRENRGRALGVRRRADRGLPDVRRNRALPGPARRVAQRHRRGRRDSEVSLSPYFRCARRRAWRNVPPRGGAPARLSATATRRNPCADSRGSPPRSRRACS